MQDIQKSSPTSEQIADESVSFQSRLSDLRASISERLETKKARSIAAMCLIIFLFAMVPVSIFAVKQIEYLASQAAFMPVGFSFLPAHPSLAQNPDLVLAYNSNAQQVGFVKVEIDFDPKVLKLTSDVRPLSNLSKVIEQTSLSQANRSGKIILIYTIKPTDLATAPSHLFQVAAFPFGLISATPLQTGSQAHVTVNLANSEVVDVHAATLNSASQEALITLDATPLPTSTIVASPTSIASPLPSSQPGGSVSGEAMPVGDIAHWHQVFADDFTADVPVGAFSGCSANGLHHCAGLANTAYSQTWGAYPDGWKDTTKNGNYTPSKVISIHDGMMQLSLHSENGVHLVSAPVPSVPGAVGSEGGLLYGRYVIRYRADSLPGYKIAWLLWPDSETWPRDGEIDWPEGNLNGSVSAFMHKLNGANGSDQDAYPTNTTSTGWHTAVTEWLPNSLKFYLDGQLIGSSTARVPNTPMHWVIQTETSTDPATPPDNSTAGKVQIDWVSVYTPQ